jgi:hypothetical protein
MECKTRMISGKEKRGGAEQGQRGQRRKRSRGRRRRRRRRREEVTENKCAKMRKRS